MTLHEQAARARDRFIQAGIPRDEAALDARLLAQAILGWDGARFVTAVGDSGPPDFEPRYAAVVARREQREPTAYITGHREFWGLDFEVSPDVLIPRPETELIVELSREMLPDHSAPYVVADVCTGSGCIAVALAHEYPACRVIATDSSAEALAIARRNVRTHGVADRIDLIEGDLLSGRRDTFQLIVSNPPYVAEQDRYGLQREVRYEPAVALFGGSDGLMLIRRLVEQAAPRLAPDGLLLFEFGIDQAADIERLISRTEELTMVDLRRDLQGIPRTAVVRRTR